MLVFIKEKNALRKRFVIGVTEPGEPEVYDWNVFPDCASYPANQDSFQLYSIDPLIQLGITMWSDFNRTELYTGIFVIEGSVFETDSNGEIIDQRNCLTSMETYLDCESANPGPTLYSEDIPPQIGSSIYTSAESLEPFLEDVFVYNGNIYETNLSGVVSTIGACST